MDLFKQLAGHAGDHESPRSPPTHTQRSRSPLYADTQLYPSGCTQLALANRVLYYVLDRIRYDTIQAAVEAGVLSSAQLKLLEYHLR